MRRHKTFISYHHEKDQDYKDWLVDNYDGWAFIDQSVGEGDINSYLKSEYIHRKICDKYLRNSTVSIVLIGTDTYMRKHVDWEISSSIINAPINRRSGLVGLILPTRDDFGDDEFDRRTIPKRLLENIDNGYAQIYDFPFEFIDEPLSPEEDEEVAD